MSPPLACPSLIATALANNCARDLALSIGAHPRSRILQRRTVSRIFHIACGATASPTEIKLLRTVAAAILMEEME